MSISAVEGNRHPWAMVALCMSVLMIAVDASIVNVALPSIGKSLGFHKESLVWIVNAYLSAYGGFWLIGGRLGDVFGYRRVFSVGVLVFTGASLACGLAVSPELLVTGRFVQGMAGSVVSTMATTLVMRLHNESAARIKALGVCSFVASGSASAALLLGGIVTESIGWRWIFLINVPIGAFAYSLSTIRIQLDMERPAHRALDVAGAITVTGALVIGSYAVVKQDLTSQAFWERPALLVIALSLFLIFVLIESVTKEPLVPLRIFRSTNLAVAMFGGILLTAAMSGWTYFSSLYLQVVLKYSPLQVGVVFLPATVVMAIVALVIGPTLVSRVGIVRLLVIGMLCVATALVLFARQPVAGALLMDVIPGMLLIGAGIGMAENALMLGALSGVPDTEFGVASGVVNAALTMGGTLGLAILADVAASRTDRYLSNGIGMSDALNYGFQVAYLTAALFAVVAALICGIFLRVPMGEAHSFRSSV